MQHSNMVSVQCESSNDVEEKMPMETFYRTKVTFITEPNFYYGWYDTRGINNTRIGGLKLDWNICFRVEHSYVAEHETNVLV